MGFGLNEVVNYALVQEEKNLILMDNFIHASKNIEVLMPLSNEHKTLRKGIIPSLIENAKYNLARKNNDLALFEVGKVYYEQAGKPFEEEVLGLLVANKFIGATWRKTDNVSSDFYTIKGIVDNLFEHLNLKLTYLLKDEISNELHPKRSAHLYLDNKKIGFIGELHPKFSKENNLPEGIYVAEVKLNNIILKNSVKTIYEPVSKVPSMERDIAVVVSNTISADIILNKIKSFEKKILKDAYIFDVYREEKVGENEKSVAIKLIFSSEETLTEGIVNKKIEKIINGLEKDLQAKLRQ